MIKRFLTFGLSLISSMIVAQETGSEDNKPLIEKTSLSALKFRSIGPALTSGRIADLAVNPNNHAEYYVATASGGVWKTTNHGITYHPVFDDQGSYSIGCITLDPSNPHVIWVGSGENNNQRSVAYGDGIYKSEDGGKSWSNMGLKNSEHIGMIVVHPENPDVVYVAAYGPLWSSGGDRGIYKSTDGGKNWEKILDVSENTGFNEIHMDPRNPDVLYATAHQRRRHVWTYISGGPESAIYKSTDGGKNWTQLKNGIPSGDKGRIALAIPPSNPDVVYAMVEGHGVYRSDDRGASFSFQNPYETSGNYYVELVPHPTDENTVYSMDTYMHVSRDGGKSWNRLPEDKKHVDNHCLWINPDNPDQMIAGCDGGLYETYDNAANWQFKPNLPITQFYKVAVDNALPFYNIYGGTQDNFSLGGPSRTTNRSGITNADWFVTNTGDGFETVIDPVDPNIIYAQSQYGGLVRYDKKNGESVGIHPSPAYGEAAYRWNWDAPLLISPHDPHRLYFAANKVFRSDDQGNNWREISGDLSQQIDRHTLPVMGKIWSVDAIAYDASTSNYGNIVALDESPLQEGLLFAGTDDGLVHVSGDSGANWKRYENFPGIPKNTYVNMLVASKFDTQTVFAVFNNHKNGDFKPYILKSSDQGASWQNISGDLPERGSVYCLAQDHVNKELLFAGTEFGAFFSYNGGENWKPLKGGIPTIAVRDMAIQKRENDLVLATMGRGFYILDDYTALRAYNPENLDKEAYIFPVNSGLSYMQASPLGYEEVGFQGASYYFDKNPENGVQVIYYVKDEVKSLKDKRQAREKETRESNGSISYPSAEELRAEDREEKAYHLFVITDASGQEVSRFSEAASSGIKRVNWNGRMSSITSVSADGSPVTKANEANLALPGTYSITLYQSKDGEIRKLAGPEEFELNWLDHGTMPAEDRLALAAFQKDLEETRRKIVGVNNFKNHLEKRIEKLKANARNTPGVPLSVLDSLRQMEYVIYNLEVELNGDRSLAKRNFDTPPSLMRRIGGAVWNSYYTTMAPTGEQQKNLAIVKQQLGDLIGKLADLKVKTGLINARLIQAGAPYLDDELPENP
tara:strand:+ start:2958 stop:6206 length:3249 start_codon:yes stop_codon:yes gene_type:complete